LILRVWTALFGKLAAILAADVERTLARLRALRSDLIDPTIGRPASSGLAREEAPAALWVAVIVKPFGSAVGQQQRTQKARIGS
jgi:hypothetical protein